MRGLAKQILAAAALLVTLTGCWAKKTACRGIHKYLPAPCKAYETSDDAASSRYPGSGGTPPQAAGGFPLTRVTPEQLSNNFELTVHQGAQFRITTNATGQTIDQIVAAYGVPLGGIDFTSVSTRDPNSKAQTLLVGRVLASELAALAVFSEVKLAAAQRTVFTKCDPNQDRPVMPSDSDLPAATQAVIQAGEANWQLQVEELFWRFYARPPTSGELASVRAAFVTTMQNEGYPPAGWVTVLYAMLASQEFWHI